MNNNNERKFTEQEEKIIDAVLNCIPCKTKASFVKRNQDNNLYSIDVSYEQKLKSAGFTFSIQMSSEEILLNTQFLIQHLWDIWSEFMSLHYSRQQSGELLNKKTDFIPNNNQWYCIYEEYMPLEEELKDNEETINDMIQDTIKFQNSIN